MAIHSIKILFRILPLLLSICISSSSDPNPLQDLCVSANPSKPSINGFICKDPAKAVAADFKTSLLAKPGNTSNSLGSALTIATASSFPGLNTQGLSFARIDYKKGGIVQPHFHPRASEVLYVMKGTLRAGFVDTQNRLFEEILKEGELFVFPQGMVHFIENLGGGSAVSLSSLNSQNPGAVLLAKTLFASKPAVPDTVLAKAFKISLHDVHSMQIGLSRP